MTNLYQQICPDAEDDFSSRAAPVDRRWNDGDERSAALSTLNAFAIDLISIRNADDLFWYVARNVVGRLNFVDCVIYQANDEQTILQQVAALGEKNPYDRTIANPLRIAFGDGITGRTAQSQTPIIVNDLRADQSYIYDTMAARSEICVPLLSMGRVVGVIDSEHPEPQAFGEAELEVLTTIAAMTSAKLELLAEEARSNQRYADLVHSHAQLAQEINNRKALESKLFEARKLEAIGRITGGFAHGFNNLLTVISGNLDLLKQESLGEGATECLREAQLAAQKGADVIQDLVGFAQRARLQPERIDPRDLIQDVFEHSDGQLRPLMSVDVPDEMWCVTADRTGARVALTNLIMNAQDAMKGAGELRIRASNLSLAADMSERLQFDLPSGRYVRVEITDQGDGIPAEILHRVFDPFFSTKPTGIGAGLGLSLVQGFMRQSGGAVHVRPAEPKGTTFELIFPADGEGA